ncbi:hypothetical protein Mapa_000050 [Marchantia paleacea]|nr:hypothetical protein Mapa_000050 [Marchantia paleacea]
MHSNRLLLIPLPMLAGVSTCKVECGFIYEDVIEGCSIFGSVCTHEYVMPCLTDLPCYVGHVTALDWKQDIREFLVKIQNQTTNGSWY